MRGGLRAYRYIRAREFIDPFKNFPGGFHQSMNRREAQLILGVSEGADGATIRQRHRVMMMNNHPDSEGSNYLATKVN